MKPRSNRDGLCALVIMAAAGVISLASSPPVKSATQVTRPPRMTPDYRDVMVPPNIAPLCFRIDEPGRQFELRISSTRGTPIPITSRHPEISIPQGPWHKLLAENAGEKLHVEIAVKTAAGEWQRFSSITNEISPDPLDGYLVYRKLNPQYSMYGTGTMGIYQRALTSFEEKVILEVKGQNPKVSCCINCHTFPNNRPEQMALHIRSHVQGKPMLLAQNGQVAQVARTTGYLAWHPSMRLLAFSANRLSLLYHAVGETRDVFDSESNLGIYRVDSNAVVAVPALARQDRQENWPAWSPDGRYLYYCSAPKTPFEQFREVRYDLMRIPYDLASDRWGAVETILTAAETHLSIAQPRISPDGHFLLFGMCQYGNFPIYQKSSDLYLMDLVNRQYRRLELNSDQCESWHCWSSNGRWIVFSSKRLDGYLARPFFSHIDGEGRVTKPFVLPQAEPAFYESCLKTFNLPELITGPVPVTERDLVEAIFTPRKVLKPTTDTAHSGTELENQGETAPAASTPLAP